MFDRGPASIKDLVEEVAGRLKEITAAYPDIDFHFKATAKPTTHDSFRGRSKGCEILTAVGKLSVSKQLPTSTCPNTAPSRQTRLRAANPRLPLSSNRSHQAARQCVKHKRSLNVKKGQFLAPWDMLNVVEKSKPPLIRGSPGGSGSPSGVRVSVTTTSWWTWVLPQMRAHGVPVIFDATHSVQLPAAPLARSHRRERGSLRRWPGGTAVGIDVSSRRPTPDQ